MISYPYQVGSTITRVIEGVGGAVPMVFVHGVSSYAHRWLHNVEAFAPAGYRGYAIDLPGHGFATKDGAFDHSVPGYAAFLASFLDEIGTGPAVLVGTSLGGHVVGALACRQPERVRSLVMAGSVGIVEVGADVRRMIANAILKPDSDGIRQKLTRAHADPSLVTDAWVDEEVRINNSPGARETFERLAGYFTANLDDDCVGAELAALSRRIPILLVWGEWDRSLGLEVAEAAHRRLTGSRLAVIRGAGHAPYFERPDAFNGIVEEFLSGSLDALPSADIIYR